MSDAMQNTDRERPDYDVLIVGAGLGGLYTLYRLRQLGFRTHVLESGTGVGGTWYWNRYPGARCDVESHQYSYSFDEDLQREWTWTERYPAQPEILRYIEHVADRHDLKRDISFGTTVTAADYDERRKLWILHTANEGIFSARFCVMATGCLSVPRLSVLPGQDNFKGEIYYTALWPHKEPDLTGKRVAVVGTSASGTQSIPQIAARAAHLTVFQRTANFSVPSQNGPMDPAIDAQWKQKYTQLREQQRRTKPGVILDVSQCSAHAVSESDRRAIYEQRWKVGGLGFMRSFSDLFVDKAANDTAVAFVHDKIDEIVKNKEFADKLKPRDHQIGTRRICTDNGYYDTFNRDNVSLVDVRADPIVEVTGAGIRTKNAARDFDVIVMATGFEAMIGALCKIDIRGRGGRLLRDKWRRGPLSYLGVAVEGFPNLFTQAGPLGPGTLASFYLLNEQQGDWFAGLAVYMRANGLIEFEAQREAEDEWAEHTKKVAAPTLHYRAPESSYIFKGPGGERVFMVYIGGFNAYCDICETVASDGYTGFNFKPASPASQTHRVRHG